MSCIIPYTKDGGKSTVELILNYNRITTLICLVSNHNHNYDTKHGQKFVVLVLNLDLHSTCFFCDEGHNTFIGQCRRGHKSFFVCFTITYVSRIQRRRDKFNRVSPRDFQNLHLGFCDMVFFM